MTKHILSKQQRLAGLDTFEYGHNLYLQDMTLDTNIREYVAVFGTHATIQEIQKAANDYLIGRNKVKEL